MCFTVIVRCSIPQVSDSLSQVAMEGITHSFNHYDILFISPAGFYITEKKLGEAPTLLQPSIAV